MVSWRAALLAGLLIALCPATARGTYPGVNGPLIVGNGVQASTLSPDGSLLKPLVRADEAVLSPDGKRIAYVTSHEGPPCGRFCTYYTRVWVARRDGDHPRPVTGPRGHAESPKFSRNGRNILWRDEHEFWAARSSGKHKHVLFSADDLGLTDVRGGFDLSPDGRKIAFAGAVDSGFRIFVARADGEGEAMAVSSHDSRAEDYDPSWSPDGKRIAFTRLCDDAQCSQSVFVVRADGSQAFEFENDPNLLDESSAAWSPSGRRIAFGFINAAYSRGIAVRRAVPNSPVKVLTRKDLDLFDWAPLPFPDADHH